MYVNFPITTYFTERVGAFYVKYVKYYGEMFICMIGFSSIKQIDSLFYTNKKIYVFILPDGSLLIICRRCHRGDQTIGHSLWVIKSWHTRSRTSRNRPARSTQPFTWTLARVSTFTFLRHAYTTEKAHEHTRRGARYRLLETMHRIMYTWPMSSTTARVAFAIILSVQTWHNVLDVMSWSIHTSRCVPCRCAQWHVGTQLHGRRLLKVIPCSLWRPHTSARAQGWLARSVSARIGTGEVAGVREFVFALVCCIESQCVRNVREPTRTPPPPNII